MRTDGHALVGGAIALSLFGTGYSAEELLACTLCIAGTVAPDLVMVPLWFLDKARGKTPLLHIPKWAMEIVEIGHSLPLWLGAIAASLFTLRVAHFDSWVFIASFYLFTFALGVASHCVIDAFTHCADEFADTDQTMIWPFNYIRGLTKVKLGRLVGKLLWGGWDYRRNRNTLTLKTPERILDGILIAVNLILMVRFLKPLF